MTKIYRAALQLLPADVRERHGDQMAAVFADLLRDARRRRGARVLRLTVAELTALAWFAWRVRRNPNARAHSRTFALSHFDDRLLSWTLEPEGTPPMLASLVQDVRYAARMLRRTPGLTVVCVSTMALAIGANSAIFSVVNGVLLQPLPYPDADRLVVLGHFARDGSDGGALGTTTPGNFYDWQARASAFDGMAAYSYTERTLAWDGGAERVLGALGTGRMFDVLRRSAAAGRTFTDADDDAGAAPVVVLSTALARRIYGDRSAVGQSFAIGGAMHTVVGVMPPDFVFPDYDAEYWLPARYAPAFRANRDQYFLQAIARLAPGMSIDQARAQLDTVMDGIRRDHAQYTQNATAGVAPLKALLVDNVRTRLLTLMGAVVVILLIACANLGNLLMARASTRRREMAVRQAIGARPARLVRQMLTESVLFALAGGAAGVALGYGLLDVLVALLPDTLPRANAITLDATVLAYTAAVSFLAGIAFGLAPAIDLVRGTPLDAVREGMRGSARSGWLRTSLVVSEVALALVLLAGAGLLTRSFGKLLEVAPGFSAGRALTFSLAIPGTTYSTPAARLGFYQQAIERLRALPAVSSVSYVSTLPVTARGNGAWFNMLDKPWPPGQTPPGVPYRVVSPNYLQAFGIPLRRGRHFTEDDSVDRMRAVIISESVAARFWPNQDPIGRRIYLGAPDNRLAEDMEIVGIAGNVRLSALDSPIQDVVYVPHKVMPSWGGFSFVLQTSMEPGAVTSAAREEVRRIDPAVPLNRVRTMDEVMARSVAPARSSMLLVGTFAALALLLAVVGVFGVLSYSVSQRTTELGIRLALGASARQVKLLVLGQGMMPVVAGIVIGLAGALALTRFMETLLFGVTPTDPATFATVAALLASIAALASYLPARRATRVDPVTVLRNE